MSFHRLATALLSLVLAGAAATAGAACPHNDSGLVLPAGFCASVFADDIGHARHLSVAPGGVVYVNTWSGKYYGDRPPPAGGFLVALRDTNGQGRADVIERFGATVQSGGAGGTGILVYNGALYAEINDRIVRYRLRAGEIVPQDPPQTIVSGLPLGGDHPMHPFTIDRGGRMYVDVGSATNSCQLRNRMLESPGAMPCTELETRGGIWRFDANKTRQVFSPAARYATGIRNAEGLAIDSTGQHLFVTQHGRDQLHANWPKLFKPEEEALLPAEELLLLQAGGDYGWPECYYDPIRRALVLAPEYGGNGGAKIGVCAQKIEPVAAYPAHWAPDDMVYYDKTQFPAHYRDGVFIAFHGSWNRAPYPQEGYNVVFQALDGARAAGRCEIFADGFAGPVKTPGGALHRPSGLSVGDDGALYVSDDVSGRIYRIVYRGGAEDRIATHIVPCPGAAAEAATAAAMEAGSAPNASPIDAVAATAMLPAPPGATRQIMALGYRVYHGQVGGAACAGCHGADGKGTPLGPDLSQPRWLWSDGSYAGLIRTIGEGVSQPKRYRAPMPAMGGAELSREQVAAAAAYVWGLSHRAP